MTEQEYIVLSNKVKIESTLKILDSVETGYKCGVNCVLYNEALWRLNQTNKELAGMAKIDEQDG